MLSRFGMVALVCALSAGTAMAEETRIAVVGEGSVTAAPDMARLTLGVEARDETATGAMARVAASLEGVMAVLSAAGIAPADVQSSGVSLQPVYEQAPRQESPPVQTGLLASSDLTVRVRDVALLGGLLDDVARAGGNRFSGLSWDMQDRAPLLADARRAAVADGLAKATLYADAAGVPLGELVLMAEEGAEPQPMMMMEASMRSMPMAPGEIEIGARLRMVFEYDD